MSSSKATTSDCWSESATSTLINSWGSHYLELNRGKLTRTHWLAVADSVNTLHPNHRRTHLQCQNRIDTIKKRFKILKTSNPNSSSSWPHFRTLDYLIGGNTRVKPRQLKSHSPESSPEVLRGPRTKRKLEGDGVWERRFKDDGICRKAKAGCRALAEAMGRLGMVYERVELEKNRQMVELEKQRMLFFRDLEMFRIQFFIQSCHFQNI